MSFEKKFQTNGMREAASKSRVWKTVWVWLLIAATAGLVGGTALVHGFLAVQRPNGTGILVVEAWIPVHTLREAAAIFSSGHYQYLVVVGGPMGIGSENGPGRPTYADRAFNGLAQIGFDMSKVIRIPVAFTAKRRSYASAKAVSQWLRLSKLPVHEVDVFTLDVHARKSWILFRHALGTGYRVGIIAGAETSYNPERWLLSPRGRWVVARNAMGYVYTILWVSLDKLACPQSQAGELHSLHSGFPSGDVQASNSFWSTGLWVG